MWKRLIKSKKNRKGYTLTELLVVIGIIAVVCAIAIPSVIAISRSLRFKQRNDYAKSIFMAAQQNLTEMRSDGALTQLQESGGAYTIPENMSAFPEGTGTEYVYTTTGEEAFNLVLPAGSIDASVREEQIIIEYNPLTGNVYAVFYSEERDSIVTSYNAGTLPRDDADQRKKMMLGYYDGSDLSSSKIELEKTQAMVQFTNGEEGIVTVMVPMPDSFFGSSNDFITALQVDLTVMGEYSMNTMADPDETESATAGSFTLTIKNSGENYNVNGDLCTLGVDGKTVMVEFPIDSLVSMKSFANYASGTVDTESLTTLTDESKFTVLPGENVTIQAEVTYNGTSGVLVEIEPGILSGVNPMFEYLQPSADGGYVLAVSNGRNLQNLNALAPTIAEQVESVVFTDDIYWNETVDYYNDVYGGADGSYKNLDEAPARALPYFVPIHSESLFGTAKFIYPSSSNEGSLLEQLLGSLFGFGSSEKVPTLTDELDQQETASGSGVTIADTHATINGEGHKVYYLNIDTTKYCVGKGYYAGTADADLDRFTGLFSYVNTAVDNLHVVNPIIKGYSMNDNNNPATGALIGAAGYNTYVSNCSVYLDTKDENFVRSKMTQSYYNADTDQTWYGVSGEGAVGGLVGYAKSHRTTTGDLTNDKRYLAYNNCFAAVNVSGTMRVADKTKTTSIIPYRTYKGYAKDYGYSNGVGGFIGNSQLTNFYNCYASGNVMAKNCNVAETWATGSSLLSAIKDLFGISQDLLYNGRESIGAGGFVGTSHGTRYSNCFATGDVTATSSTSDLGAGGFVGMMCIDENKTYGNGGTTVDQRTVFTNCYAVGRATANAAVQENFSGANGRVIFNIDEFGTYVIGDYFRLYAPYYHDHNGQAPDYGDSVYFYRDSYYLTRTGADNENSLGCANPMNYENLQNLTGIHKSGSEWIEKQIEKIKSIVLVDLVIYKSTYETEYFNNHSGLTTEYRTLYAEGYSESIWGPASSATTHSYNMSSGAAYPFTKLNGLDYYGDWPSKPSGMGMAYYETYDGVDGYYYLFDKDRGSSDARLALKNGESTMVDSDGYAIFSVSSSDLTVTIGSVTRTLECNNDAFEIEGNEYSVFILSDELMEAAADAVGSNFYVEVKAQHGSGSTYTMYFNPNAADTQVNPTGSAATAVKPTEAPNEIIIRSARQFAGISTMESFWSDDYKYIQELNIDVEEYDWAEGSDCKVASIGSSEHPFNAVYTTLVETAAGGTLKQADLNGFIPAEAGFFGVIGENGKVEKLDIEISENLTLGSTTIADAAVLAGSNAGTISNVTLNIGGTVELTAKNNAGLLAGYTSGTITKCQVTAEEKVTMTAANAGGFVGTAEGTADENLTFTGCTLEMQGDFEVKNATNAGGFIGAAKYVAIEEPEVSLKGMTADATNAGGLMGYAEQVSVTATEDDGKEITLSGAASNSKGIMGGAVGTAKDVTLGYVDVSVLDLSGKTAAGLLGVGQNADASNCSVVVGKGKSISGTELAAGVLGSIDENSIFKNVSVDLSGVSVTSNGSAAGYAGKIMGEVYSSGVTLSGSEISGTTSAAGYAITVGNYVESGSVTGKGTISGGKAAGFAVELLQDKDITSSWVSPAQNNGEYAGNANKNLTVTGTTDAAGFVLTVGSEAEVSKCYTLCKVSVDSNTEEAKASGFALINSGYITASTANVDIGAGSAFVGTNNGQVSRCYGWYGDHDKTQTATVATVGGTCYSSYFADLAPNTVGVDVEQVMSVTLYTAGGTEKTLTARELQEDGVTLLTSDGSGYVWYSADNTTDASKSHPYNAEMDPPNYLYPMLLQHHYGDWTVPPQYAYGVAYYETYADGSVKIHLLDLSNEAITEENKDISATVVIPGTETYTAKFNEEGTINEAGYAVFSKTGTKPLGSLHGDQLNFNYKYVNTVETAEGTVVTEFTYDFYKLNAGDGEVTVKASNGSGESATVNTYYADAINDTDGIYEIRTPAQLGNVTSSGNYKQTHDIALTDDFVKIENFAGTYDGTGRTITAGDVSGWMTGTVNGTVTGLTLNVGNVSGSLFGDIATTGSVSLNGLTVGNTSAADGVIKSVSGSFACSEINAGNITSGSLIGAVSSKALGVTKITTGDVAGTLIGSINNTTLDGLTVNVGEVSGTVFGTVTDAALTNLSFATKTDTSFGTLFGSISGSTVKTGDLETGAVDGKLFGEIKGNATVTTGAITVHGDAKQLFDNVAGTVQTGAIKVEGNATKVFGDVTSGSVNTGAIDVNGTLNQAFGTVGAPVTVTGEINTGAVNGKVFGDVSGKVTVTKISTGTLNGNVFGAISANVTVDQGISLKTVTASSYIVAGVSSGDVKLGNVSVNSGSAAAASEESTVAEPTGTTTAPTDTATTPTDPAPPSVGTLFGPVRGGKIYDTTVALGEYDIEGNLFEAVNGGTLSNITVNTSGDLTGSLIGGDLAGKLSGVELTCGDVTLDSNGVLVSNMTSGTIENCVITAGNVTSTATTFGGITGTVPSGASLIDTSVTATMNIDGKAGSLTVVGGMVGINNGTISGGSANVTINYAQFSTDNAAEYDKARIGGIVGEVQSGGSVGEVESDGSGSVTTASGAINLTSGSGSGREYVIGGAVGYAEGNFANVTVNVEIAPNWKESKPCKNDATYGYKLTDNGPVGMFVGYAGDVTFTNCASNETSNTTYQFIGEAAIKTGNYQESVWTSQTLEKNGILSYSDSEYHVDNQYIAADGTGVTVNGKTTEDSYTYIATTLNNCTFYLYEKQKTQSYGTGEYYYEMSEEPQSSYLAKAITGSLSSTETVKFDKITSYNENLDYFYEFADGQYGRVYVECSVSNSFIGTATYTFYYYDASGNKQKFDDGSISIFFGNATSTFTKTFHKITTPVLSADGQYLVTFKDGENIYAYASEDANNPNSLSTILLKTNFLQRDVLNFARWKWSNGGSDVWTTVVTGGKYEQATTSFAVDTSGNYYASDSMPSAVYYIGEQACTIYKVEETTGAYIKVTFTHQNDSIYERQYITYTPMDDSQTFSVDESETITETLPAGETTGGETQEPNA